MGIETQKKKKVKRKEFRFKKEVFISQDQHLNPLLIWWMIIIVQDWPLLGNAATLDRIHAYQTWNLFIHQLHPSCHGSPIDHIYLHQLLFFFVFLLLCTTLINRQTKYIAPAFLTVRVIQVALYFCFVLFWPSCHGQLAARRKSFFARKISCVWFSASVNENLPKRCPRAGYIGRCAFLSWVRESHPFDLQKGTRFMHSVAM